MWHYNNDPFVSWLAGGADAVGAPAPGRGQRPPAVTTPAPRRYVSSHDFELVHSTSDKTWPTYTIY